MEANLIFFNSGVHHKKNNCESNQVISKVKKKKTYNRWEIFTKFFLLTGSTSNKRSNKGWSTLSEESHANSGECD